MNESRRAFLKRSSLFALAIGSFRVLLGVAPHKISEAFAKEQEASLPAGQSAISESDPVASAIGFKHNIKAIDYSKYPQRKKPEAKNQFCNNCALFSPINGGWGKCQMLTNGLVSSKGWCGSWSKKD